MFDAHRSYSTPRLTTTSPGAHHPVVTLSVRPPAPSVGSHALRPYPLAMSDRLPKLLKLLTLDERDTFVLYGIAQEHAKLGDHAQAIDFYDRTIAVDPAYCYAYFHKARSQLAAGKLAEARQTVQAGIAAAHRAGDHKALGELSTLQTELAEAR
jgi:tetratricopeptide (TPR) repeat protein